MKKLFFCLVVGLLIPVCSNAQYTPISIRSSSSSARTTSYSNNEVMSNISVTVGINGKWTFKFFSNGTFQSHVWYGNNGKYSSNGGMRKESFSSGTYTIKNEEGKRIVYFRYANGNEVTGELEYVGGRAKLLTDYSGYSWKSHKEIDN